MRKPFLIYDFATAPFCISLYRRKIFYIFFISVWISLTPGLKASSYMTKYLLISSYIRKPFLIYDFAAAPF
jgi:hypothetical protein